MKKFEMTSEFITNVLGTKLFRIKALIEFGDVSAGELGGYIEKEENQEQDTSCNPGRAEDSPGDRSGRHDPAPRDDRRHRKRDGHAQGHSDPGSQRRGISILGGGIQGAG